MLKLNSGFTKTLCGKLFFLLTFTIGLACHWFACHVAVAQDEKPAADTKPAETSQEKANDQPKVTIEDVRKLLKELDGKTLKDRDAAEKRLIELGPSVVSFLPEVDANTSGEMKVRLQRIRQQFQTVEIANFFEFWFELLHRALRFDGFDREGVDDELNQ